MGSRVIKIHDYSWLQWINFQDLQMITISKSLTDYCKKINSNHNQKSRTVYEWMLITCNNLWHKLINSNRIFYRSSLLAVYPYSDLWIFCLRFFTTIAPNATTPTAAITPTAIPAFLPELIPPPDDFPSSPIPVWLIALLSAASSGDGAGDGEGEEEGEFSGVGAGGESECGEGDGVGVGVGAGGDVAGEGVGVGEGEFSDEFVAGAGAGELAEEAMLTTKERRRKTRENLAIESEEFTAIDEIEFENWMVGSEIEMKKTVTENEVGSEKMVVIREKWKVVGVYIGWRIRYEDEMDGCDDCKVMWMCDTWIVLCWFGK